MELSVAKNLIQKGIDPSLPNQTWADLGAGDGLFTKALADLLPFQSKVIAVDRDERAMKNIAIHNSHIDLSTRVADLHVLPKNFPVCDGIVMANSLHYIKDQIQFLVKLKTELLKKSGMLILVEYDLEKSNPWVPYPINKKALVEVAENSGFELQILPASVKSKFNSSEIYSALLKPKV